MASISLCVMTGNEEPHVIRFLDSFAPCFDELCMVRAVANLKHDKTVSLAKEWCERHGKPYRLAEYRNAGWQAGLPEGLDVNPARPETWMHVDDFAAARNMAWDLATCDWQLWADLDDILSPDSAAKIRECAGGGDRYEMFYFTYSIRTSLESNLRERMFKRGISRWVQPIHENCRIVGGEEKVRACYEPKVIYSHEPDSSKHRDPERNTRILEYHMRFIDAFPFEIHREYFYKWQAYKKDEDAANATRWAEIAQQTNCLPDQRQAMLLNQAQIMAVESPEQAIEICWAALRIAPWNREPWGWMAEFELQRGNAKRAIYLSEMMGKQKKRPATGMPMSEQFYSWRGLHLHVRALRAGEQEEQARKVEAEFFKANGSRFSLIHATRGRPEQAIKTRDYFYRSAVCPLGVEHIFAIDEDDAESLEKLKHYRHVIVEKPNGCVKAWNTAADASRGNVLVQLSDDWMPCLEWDERCWQALAKAADGKPVGDVPLVLAVSDTHRTDGLLCMAILTRARYDSQYDTLDPKKYGVPGPVVTEPYMFHPDYFGVFSDNEFSLRAWADKCVVDARKTIAFKHCHPLFDGKPAAEWDEIHRRQNAPERYAEGQAIFNRRNPQWASTAVELGPLQQ
jgi:hypothetical protein